MTKRDEKQSPENRKNVREEADTVENGGNCENVFSPRFRSLAAMAGWDEEALLIATLVVEDTPDREFKQKKRSDLHFKTPPTNSRRKRRIQKRSPRSTPVTILNLDEEEITREESQKKKTESGKKEVKMGEGSDASSCSGSSLPCMDKLREELSCAICLEICFEPSTTPCGHSFCKKCLRSAADKCGKKCPKCRQLIGNGRSCTVNTVLWNTIQLLFPKEIETRKAVSSKFADTPKKRREETHNRERSRNLRPPRILPRRDVGGVRRGLLPSQDGDAALALRLQRDEFMEAFRGDNEQEHRRNSASLARANLRAMASRAMTLRIRGRAV